MHLLIMLGINILLAMGFALLYSTGLITIGAAAFWAVGAYSSALLVLELNLSFWLAMPLAVLISAGLALLIGAVIVRAPGVAFVVQTMVINMIVVQILGQIEFFGGWGGLIGLPRPNPLGPITFATKTEFYYLLLFLLLLTAGVFKALYASRVGRAWQSIQLNPRLALTLGINLYRYRLLAFVAASASAGLAGSFYAHYFGTIEPGTFSVFKSIYIQIYAILGGLGFYLSGPVVGALVMTFLPEFLRLSKEIEPILTGGLLIGLVVFLPGGFLSLPQRIQIWLSNRNTDPVEQGEAGP
jgi:branched-chain amino acid transport system permease protein